MIALTFSASSWATETIRLTTGEWSPFISKDLEHHGFVMRIIKESFALEGVEVQYEFFPWGRADMLVKEGVRDGLAVQPESPDFYNSDVVIEDKLVFFYSKKKPFDWNTLEDLKGISIGGVIANTYGEVITKMEENKEIAIERVARESQNLRKLLLDRIQVTPMGLAFGYSLLRKNFTDAEIKEITHHPKPIRVSQYRLALSKKVDRNKKMLQLFNAGLRKLKESGKYDQYIQEALEGKSTQK